MILTPAELQLVKEGKKTMHRVPAPGHDCRLRQGHLCTLRAGDDSVKVTITTPPRRETLAEIRPADVQREGHKHVRAFLDHWGAQYGLNLDQKVDVITFIRGDVRDIDRFIARGGPTQTCDRQFPIPHRVGKLMPNGKRYPDSWYTRACGAAFSDDPEPDKHCKACGAKRPDSGMTDNGYTTSFRQSLDGVPTLSEDELKRYVDRARINQENGLMVRRERLLAVIAELRLLAAIGPSSPKDRKHLKSIEHHVRAMDRQIRTAA